MTPSSWPTIRRLLMPRRRWLRFNLRTLLIVITLICLALGWAMNWKRERQRFLVEHGIPVGKTRNINFGVLPLPRESGMDWSQSWKTGTPLAPLPLRPLGEQGIGMMHIGPASRADFEKAQSLFPEAQILRVNEAHKIEWSNFVFFPQ